MLDDWTNPMSGKPRVRMLFYMPDHRLAYLNSIDAYGSKQSAKPLKDTRKNRCLLLSTRERILTKVISDGVVKRMRNED